MGYRFTDEFNGEPFVPGNKPGTKDPKFHSLFFELSARVDGAEEDITQNLFAGSADDFEISDDGLTVTASEEGQELGANTPFGKFLTSLVENGFPEKLLSEDDINYEPIVGTRVRFGQVVEMGKDGKPRKRVAKKGNFKGKSFDVTSTVIEQVYELPGKGGKVGGKKGKPADEDEDTDTDDAEQSVEDFAKETLIAIVRANKGKMSKEKTSMAILAKYPKHPMREDVRKLLKSETFLSEEDGWSYDAKKGVITVEED